MKAALLVVVVGLVLATAGCGGDEDDSTSATPTAEWAESYCAAIVDWANELKVATDQLRDFKSLSQKGFEQAGTRIRSATETFTDELRALGAPDTASGERARRAVDVFATKAERDLGAIERAVDNTSGVDEISIAVVPITAALSSMNKAFTTMVATLGSIGPEDELQSALEAAESCDDLAGR